MMHFVHGYQVHPEAAIDLLTDPDLLFLMDTLRVSVTASCNDGPRHRARFDLDTEPRR